MANLVPHEIEGAVAQLVGSMTRFSNLCLGDLDHLGDLDCPRLGEPNFGDCGAVAQLVGSMTSIASVTSAWVT